MRSSFLSAVVLVTLILILLFMISCGGGGENCTDVDSDGYFVEEECAGVPDCDDTDAALNQDDSDSDGYSTCDGDCDDDPATGFAVNPDEAEVCDDLIDNNCDGLVDCYDLVNCFSLDPACTDCVDVDLDSYFAETVNCSGGNDCADADSTINPGADNDIDGADSCADCDDFNTALNLDDADSDGYTTCDGDCNDDPFIGNTIYPGATEICDGLDNDCNNLADEGNPGSGGSCGTGLPGICAAGTEQCQGGSLVCVQNFLPQTEICNGLDDDCNGQVDEGDPGGGGSCATGLPGIGAAGTEQCQGGSLVCVQDNSPQTEICNGLDDDCDGSVDEDWPQSVNNGTLDCSAGSLGLTCAPGYDDCDGNTANGCEVQLSGWSNTFGNPYDLGSQAGDSRCGPFCSGSNWQTAAQRNGKQGRYFSFTALEVSDCPADIGARVTLAVPAGVDYDLYVSGGDTCSGAGCSSMQGSGATEQITVNKIENFGSDDSFTIDIEVRYFDGSSCGDWTLNVEGTDCQ